MARPEAPPASSSCKMGSEQPKYSGLHGTGPHIALNRTSKPGRLQLASRI